MGPNPHTFAGRLANKVASGQNAVQTQGQKIMQFAEAIRPYIAEWLQNARTRDGLPVQPATVRAVALNTAQEFLKQHPNW